MKLELCQLKQQVMNDQSMSRQQVETSQQEGAGSACAVGAHRQPHRAHTHRKRHRGCSPANQAQTTQAW